MQIKAKLHTASKESWRDITKESNYKAGYKNALKIEIGRLRILLIACNDNWSLFPAREISCMGTYTVLQVQIWILRRHCTEEFGWIRGCYELLQLHVVQHQCHCKYQHHYHTHHFHVVEWNHSAFHLFHCNLIHHHTPFSRIQWRFIFPTDSSIWLVVPLSVLFWQFTWTGWPTQSIPWNALAPAIPTPCLTFATIFRNCMLSAICEVFSLAS